VGSEKTNSPNLDIRRAIEQSTSDVALSDLAKKGFKQVKVLNGKVIMGLIAEAVDNSIALRQSALSDEEREKVVRESQRKFEGLVQEKLATDRELRELRAEREQLRARIAELESRAGGAVAAPLSASAGSEGGVAPGAGAPAAAASGVAAATGAAPAPESGLIQQLSVALLSKLGETHGARSEMSDLKSSIQGLAEKIAQMGAFGGGGGGAGAAFGENVDLERLFSAIGSEGMETNVSKVKVKQSKAGGVQNTLAKLKALQQGGAKDGE
jgi:hypothetical protein